MWAFERAPPVDPPHVPVLIRVIRQVMCTDKPISQHHVLREKELERERERGERTATPHRQSVTHTHTHTHAHTHTHTHRRDHLDAGAHGRRHGGAECIACTQLCRLHAVGLHGLGAVPEQ